MTSNVQTVEALIGVASRLIALMQREAEALRGMRVADIVPLQAEKSALTLEYETLTRALSAEPETLARVGGALREEFARVAAAFDTALRENERALHAARTAQGRLIEAIAEAVGNQRERVHGYCASGTREPARRPERSRP